MFSPVDWVVFVAYLAVVCLIGWRARASVTAPNEIFLARRSIRVIPAAVSVVATMFSAATFVGGPQQTFNGNLTYLTANIAAVFAAIAAATIFIPAYYQKNVVSIYGLLTDQYGIRAGMAASGLFMAGRLLASGARLYIVALPFSLIVFGDTSTTSLCTSIGLVSGVALIYTAVGGIRAVIWTDVLQAVIIVIAAGMAVTVLYNRIDQEPGVLFDALDSKGKLQLIDLNFDTSRPYSFWAVITGMFLFYLAAFGVDQDLSQRTLTCADARRGSRSIVLAVALAVPLHALFLLIGLLLFAFYQLSVPGSPPHTYIPKDSETVFVTFVLQEMPAGVRGLIIAGLLAAAMSSVDSALNALVTTTVVDFVRPAARPAWRNEATVTTGITVAWATMLAAVAVLCVFWQRAMGSTLIDFALGIMVFAYSGLLGVFLTALLTRRGSQNSVIAGLVAGPTVVLALYPPVWSTWAAPFSGSVQFSYPWQMLAGTIASLLVCCCGRRETCQQNRSSLDSAERPG